MKKLYCFLALTGVLLFSCNRDTKESELMTVPVDIDQNESLHLSTIAAEITAIELELTDESLINPDRIIRVLLTENNVILAERDKILVFSNKGEYLRSIGNKGQGPGEYISVRNLTVDEKNGFFYVSDFVQSKLIRYDLNGNFIKESSTGSRLTIKDLNYINDELLIVVEYDRRQDSKGLFQRSVIYTLDNDMQFVDSCVIRNSYFEKIASGLTTYENFILYGNGSIYTYYPEKYFST